MSTTDTPDPLTADPTLGEMVTANPSTSRVFERYQLDYCCGGAQRLSTACAAAGIEPATVVAAIAELEPQPSPDWAALAPADLVDHLEATHHRYLHAELPRLSALADKVVGVHGGRHAELFEVQTTYEQLRAELEPHLAKEEQVLFPMIRELQEATSAPSFHCGHLSSPIGVMRYEHDQAGELLARLRELTSDHTPPPDACGSFQALYAGLAEMEADTHQHIHKENNVLFPAVLEMEAQLG
jgi:regulator of cell morphogenesis and NO signaling